MHDMIVRIYPESPANVQTGEFTSTLLTNLAFCSIIREKGGRLAAEQLELRSKLGHVSDGLNVADPADKTTPARYAQAVAA
jgi:hypothetical protein